MKTCTLSPNERMHTPTTLHKILLISRWIPSLKFLFRSFCFRSLDPKSLPSWETLRRLALNNISPFPETGVPGALASVPSCYELSVYGSFSSPGVWIQEGGHVPVSVPLEPNTKIWARGGQGFTVRGSGNIECTRRHVSFRKVHGQSVTIAAKAAF